MTYETRPWLKFYDKWVDPDIKTPETTVPAWMEASFAEFADRPAYRFMGASMTFRDFDAASLKFANFLKEIGCGPGDVVGINLPNLPQYLIALAGSFRAGCAVTGISPLLSPKEMAYQINDCGAKVLVTLDAIFEGRVTKFHDKAPKMTHVVAVNIADYMPFVKKTLGKLLKKIPTGKVTPLPGKTVMTMLELLAKYEAKPISVKIDPGDTCLIQYTGGTTGLPKGTELTHRNLITNMCQSMQWFETERGKEVYISAFPMFHLAGLAFGMSGLGTGNTQILIPDPRNVAHICSEFAKYAPTQMANVPSLYQMLIEHPAFKTLNFSSLRIALSGAAPFAVENIKSLEAIIGAGKVCEVYGMTETSPLMTMNPKGGGKKIGSVGLPIQSTYIKIMDLETGLQEMPVGEEGELVVRGPQVMKGYFGKADESAHALRQMNGHTWLYTGDVSKMDADGYFYIVDRAKDMLNVGGYKVFSREVEESLYSVDMIEMCAIIGIPNIERPGSEIVKGFIKLKPEYKNKPQDALRAEVMAYCRENMAPYKIPKTIEFIDDIPLTAVGKVDKKALRPAK